MNKTKTFKFIFNLCLTAIMITLSVVLSRFASIYIPLGGMPSLRLSLGNLPLILVSLICGPIWGMISGASADLIGALAFPVGAYFFGYTIDSALIGLFPWLINKFMHGKKKLEFFYSLSLSLVGLFIAITYLYTHTVYSNGKNNFKYELILDNGTRLTVTLILIALASLSFIVIVLLAKLVGREKSLLHEEKPRYEMFRGRLICTTPDSLKKKDGFSFFDIASFYLTSGLLVSILLLPFWNYLFFTLPYYYGVFNNLIFMWIEGPIKIFVYWVVLNILKRAGLMNVQSLIKGSYEKSAN